MSARLSAVIDDRSPRKTRGPVCVLTNMCTGTHEREVVHFPDKALKLDAFRQTIHPIRKHLADEELPQWSANPHDNLIQFKRFVEQVSIIPFNPLVHSRLNIAYQNLTGQPFFCSLIPPT